MIVDNIKEHLLFTMFTVACMVTFMALGFWQIDRLGQKKALIETIESRMQTALPLDLTLIKKSDEIPYQKILFSGTYDHENEIHVAGKYIKGSLGYHIVTPLKIESGESVLVNRGWVDEADKALEKRPETAVTGIQSIEGFILPPRLQPFSFLPTNQPGDNMWLWLDIQAMRDHINTPKLYPTLIQVIDETPDELYPVPIESVLTIRNDHLEYAITWFSLMFATFIMTLIYLRKNAVK